MIRLGEHHSRRHQSRAALSLVQAKAVSLLTPPAASPVLGVREESELKAIKFSLATRLRDVRLAATKAREDMAADRTILDKRKDSIAKRRANLTKARSLLDNLTTDGPAPSTPTTPAQDSLSTLRASHNSLFKSHRQTLLRLEDARANNVRDLITVFDFNLATSYSPSQSAFLASDPFRSSSSDASSSSISSLDHSDANYVIADLAIPRVSELSVVPPAALSTVLSHLVHLVRLLAMYYSLELPFTPNPSLFEPGRPGVVAAPGWSTGVSSKGFPCFILRKGKKGVGGSATGGVEGTEQSGGREFEGSIRDEEEKEERAKAVVGGAVALAFDFAWIAWRRGGEDPGANPEVLDDLGLMVLNALGGWPKDRPLPTQQLPKTVPRSTKFPLDFATVFAHYSAPSLKLVASIGGPDDAEDGWDIV
ncbi:hypothetical protein P7C70_g7193, partial [Phenoliferia sp. Uapishka_3]